MPRTKIKVPPDRWHIVRVHEVYYDELIEICKYLELPIPQCLGHLIHEAYVQLDVEKDEIVEEKVNEVKKQVKNVVKNKTGRHIPPPPP